MIGALLVSMAASSAIAADAPATQPKPTKYVCQNNQCKGHADCAGFGNAACKGHNECKGQGILKAKTQAECEKKVGLWVAKK